MSHSLIYQILLTLHLIGLMVGMGAATIADYSLFRNLRMGDRISTETVEWMRSFSQVVWGGLGILAVSGCGLFLLEPAKYLHSSGFMAKMLFVLILIINGLFLNFYTTARLTTFNFSQKYRLRDMAWKARKLSFIFGAISATTWYATLLTAMFKSYIHASFGVYVGVYILALGGAVFGSMILEKVIYTRMMPRTISTDLTKMPITSLANYSASVYKEQLAQSMAKPAVSSEKNNETK